MINPVNGINEISILHMIKDFSAHYYILLLSVFLILHIVFGILFLPCSIFTVFAGIIWGGWIGLLISLAGLFLTLLSTTYVKIFHFNKLLAKVSLLIKKIKWIEKLGPGANLAIIALICLNPIVPGSSAGYFWKLTTLSRVRFLFLAFVLLLPYQLIYVFLGVNINEFLLNTGKKFLLILTAIMIFALNLFIKRYFDGRTSLYEK